MSPDPAHGAHSGGQRPPPTPEPAYPGPPHRPASRGEVRLGETELDLAQRDGVPEIARPAVPGEATKLVDPRDRSRGRGLGAQVPRAEVALVGDATPDRWRAHPVEERGVRVRGAQRASELGQ